MAEYVLDPGHWPELPPMHRAFLDRALPMFQADARLAGLAAGGSFITGELDEYSDLDLVVVSLPGASPDVLREGSDIAQRLGDRKSTRLNSSHDQISYAVFCLKKKTTLKSTRFSIRSFRSDSSST